MKVTITGVEASEGISKKSGKEYSIGRLFALVKLAPPRGEGNVSKGLMGSEFECDANLVRKIAHLPFPIEAEIEIGFVMQFGERKEVVIDLKPVEVVRKAA